MPRYSINLDPFARPVTPESDALTMAVAQVTSAIQRRREMEADREERDLARAEQRAERERTHQRQDRMDQLTLEDRDYRREMDERRLTLEDEDRTTRKQDRQLNIERQAEADQRLRDRDAIDLFKMNEDLDYRDRQAAERQIQNMNIEDARREATEARAEAGKMRGEQRERMTFKEARALALDEAKARAGKDAMGYAKPVDPALVDQLTEQFLGRGASEGGDPNAGQVLPQNIDPAALRALDILDGPKTAQVPAPAPDPTPAPAPAPAKAAAPPPTQITRVPVSYVPMGGIQIPGQYVPGQPTEADRLSIADQPPATPPANPNVPAPDPKYLDHMEQLSQVNPENFKKILRELKLKHPEEYAATVQAIAERENARRTISAK